MLSSWWRLKEGKPPRCWSIFLMLWSGDSASLNDWSEMVHAVHWLNNDQGTLNIFSMTIILNTGWLDFILAKCGLVLEAFLLLKDFFKMKNTELTLDLQLFDWQFNQIPFFLEHIFRSSIFFSLQDLSVFLFVIIVQCSIAIISKCLIIAKLWSQN